MTDRAAKPQWPWLPDMLRYLAENAGLAAALQLSSEFGGQNVYLPKIATPRHPIAKALGVKALAVLCKRYGGSHVDIPLGTNGQLRKWALKIAQLDDQELSANRIAAMVGCHERTVRNHRRKRRDGAGIDTRQTKLL